MKTEPKWYAAYTKPRAEKKVFERLLRAGFEAYLPLRRVQKKWSDRLKWVEEPLIRSYIFVRITEREYYDVINTPGMVRYVTFEGKAASIPDKQIEALRLLLLEGAELEVSTEYFQPGQKITIRAGMLLGMQGELVEYRGRKKVLVRLGDTGQNLLVTVGLEMLEAN